MLIEMQSAMKTMMNTQFSDHLPTEGVKDRQEPLLLLPQEELNSKSQQEQEHLSNSSPVPPPLALPDIAKEEVIGMVTRAHKDTFMYNQEQPENLPPVEQSQSEDRILKYTEQYNSCNEPNSGGTNSAYYGGSEQHFNGQYKGRNAVHYLNSRNLCFSNSHYTNLTNGFTVKGFHRMPENGFHPNDILNTYSHGTGGRMHLVLFVCTIVLLLDDGFHFLRVKIIHSGPRVVSL